MSVILTIFIQSTLALRTPPYYGHRVIADSKFIPTYSEVYGTRFRYCGHQIMVPRMFNCIPEHGIGTVSFSSLHYKHRL